MRRTALLLLVALAAAVLPVAHSVFHAAAGTSHRTDCPFAPAFPGVLVLVTAVVGATVVSPATRSAALAPVSGRGLLRNAAPRAPPSLLS